MADVLEIDIKPLSPMSFAVAVIAPIATSPRDRISTNPASSPALLVLVLIATAGKSTRLVPNDCGLLKSNDVIAPLAVTTVYVALSTSSRLPPGPVALDKSMEVTPARFVISRVDRIAKLAPLDL